jgi:hypothetical protein
MADDFGDDAGQKIFDGALRGRLGERQGRRQRRRAGTTLSFTQTRSTAGLTVRGGFSSALALA